MSTLALPLDNIIRIDIQVRQLRPANSILNRQRRMIRTLPQIPRQASLPESQYGVEVFIHLAVFLRPHLLIMFTYAPKFWSEFRFYLLHYTVV
jgi:hypothetical protein